MKVYQTNEIKNIALLGSAGSGKTTLAESMVYEAGIIKRRGTVEGKNTMSDYFPVEQEYGYSVFSTVFHVEWNNKKLNIIDCPGSDDFVGGAITALNVTDQAVILINGQYGPEVGTMNAFRNTEKLKKPVIFLVNQLDRDNCDFDQILAQLKEVYGPNCVPVQYPIATGAGFNSVIDVLLMKKYSWKPEGGAPIIEDVPADASAPTSLYFFKTGVEPHIGEVQYFKVMSGIVKSGDDLTNADRGSKERMGTLYACAGANRIPVDELRAGDIGCTVKLKDVKTGNTLNGKDVENKFNFIKYPNSKFSRAIKAVNEAETEKMMAALQKMRQEDPTWVVEQSKELRQIIVHGQGEFHLRTLKWRMENNEKIQVEYQEPKIPYRETITKMARADYRHKKQSGGAGQFGEVHLIVEPYTEGMPDPTSFTINGQEFKMNIKSKEEKDLEWGGKLVFINSVVGGAIDMRFMPAILKGIMERMEQGPLTGSYARDVRVIVYDGKMHPVDSNELSFMLAARNAFSAAFKEAGPKVLEPIYDLEVLVPADYMGDVMSDLQGRRAIIMGMDSEAGYQKLTAKIPLKELASYSIALSSLTGGRASFTTSFSSYELVPNDIQQALIKEHEAEMKDED